MPGEPAYDYPKAPVVGSALHGGLLGGLLSYLFTPVGAPVGGRVLAGVAGGAVSAALARSALQRMVLRPAEVKRMNEDSELAGRVLARMKHKELAQEFGESRLSTLPVSLVGSGIGGYGMGELIQAIRPKEVDVRQVGHPSVERLSKSTALALRKGPEVPYGSITSPKLKGELSFAATGPDTLKTYDTSPHHPGEVYVRHLKAVRRNLPWYQRMLKYLGPREMAAGMMGLTGLLAIPSALELLEARKAIRRELERKPVEARG